MKLHQITIDRKSLSEEVIYKYGDLHAGFRELIQNAKDAILDYQEHHLDFKGMILVNIFPNMVEVTDNGIGMNVKDVDDFLLKMYGTSKDRDARNRAGVFGRGFFAIFKETTEAYVFTKAETGSRMYLRVYPKESWFIAEELSLSEVPSKALAYGRKVGAHGSTVLCFPRTGFNTDGIYNYLTQVCQFFDMPIIVNGQAINRSFGEALNHRGSRAIITFNKHGIQGALGYQANDNMIQTFVHHIKILNLISPEGGVNGYINYDNLEVTPSRDALVQNASYEIFIQVLTEMCNAVLRKLSENPTPDDLQRLLDFAHSSSDHTILNNLRIFKLVGIEEKFTLKQLLALAQEKRVVFIAEKRTFVADRLKKRGYVVVHELSPRLKEMLMKVIRDNGMIVDSVDSAFGEKLAGILEPRRIIPEYELTNEEQTVLEVVRSMVSEKGLRVEIMEGDPLDDAEHVPGVIRLQRNGELIQLAKDSSIIGYPFMVKVLLTPLIAHEMAHEEVGKIHDESFYEVYEMILKAMQKELFDEFKILIKEKNA
ncbi:MAG: ATP-binding protein [Candidatus Helarchaeota archaeon]|nr:ATP-binding protein [Candidatus Helarchaeota archaeon]